MYFADKLNKQGDNIQLCYSFPHLEPVCCSMSSSYGSFLTCIQISQETGWVIWYSHLFQNFPQFVVIHTVKGVSLVNEAEVGVFLEFSCFFYDPTDGNLISGFSAFSKSRLNIWKFSVHVLLNPGLENFEHYFASLLWGCRIFPASSYYVPSGLTELRAMATLRPVLPPFLSSQHLHTNRLGFC